MRTTLLCLLLGASPIEARITNVAPDGSSLTLPEGWTLTGKRLTQNIGKPLHSFRRGALVGELSLIGKGGDPKTMAADLRQSYLKKMHAAGGGEAQMPLYADKFAMATTFHNLRFITPRSFIVPGRAFLIEGYFKRAENVYYYAIWEPAPEDSIDKIDEAMGLWEKGALNSLQVLSRVSWPTQISR